MKFSYLKKWAASSYSCRLGKRIHDFCNTKRNGGSNKIMEKMMHHAQEHGILLNLQMHWRE